MSFVFQPWQCRKDCTLFQASDLSGTNNPITSSWHATCHHARFDRFGIFQKQKVLQRPCVCLMPWSMKPSSTCLPSSVWLAAWCCFMFIIYIHLHHIYIYSYIIILYILIYEKTIYRQLCVHPNTHGTISCSKQPIVSWRGGDPAAPAIWEWPTPHVVPRHGWAVEGLGHRVLQLTSGKAIASPCCLLLLLRSLVAIPKRPLKQKLAQSWIMSRLGFVLKCKICPWDKAWNLIGPGELEEWNLIVPWCSMQFYAILHCSWFMLIHVDWNISQSFPPAEAVSSIRGSVLEPREIACSCWKMLNAFGQQLINYVQHLSTTVGRNLLLCATHESLELNCPVISPDSLIVAESPVLSVMRFCDLTCSLPETRWSDHSFHCRVWVAKRLDRLMKDNVFGSFANIHGAVLQDSSSHSAQIKGMSNACSDWLQVNEIRGIAPFFYWDKTMINIDKPI